MLKKYLGSFFYRLVHWIVSALALMITAKLLTGFAVDTFVTAMIAAVVLAVANAIIRPILLFFTLPINFVTLGLFTFVINGAVLKLCAALVTGFAVETWFAAIVGAIVLSIISTILHFIFA